MLKRSMQITDKYLVKYGIVPIYTPDLMYEQLVLSIMNSKKRHIKEPPKSPTNKPNMPPIKEPPSDPPSS